MHGPPRCLNIAQDVSVDDTRSTRTNGLYCSAEPTASNDDIASTRRFQSNSSINGSLIDILV